ncbi:hypothetical protein BU24DRAFT_426856 [Aaosphaeria arxii CBS 175.79]|uniref:Uncharacterized protein n=1 Tax=Aaosphaeria arxii CBS 175.79 TaxID=1450172 RepID=A0A6A5XF59_9PLEO|nr:uncharacterized protein BU24DRAFT_426856 [Aaosphaeria arxii CBS 175.79]KAF2011758.1 hypothetical protein BU24DRAFT_426856 [Aaosphaeria arxii CBS 175.79]
MSKHHHHTHYQLRPTYLPTYLTTPYSISNYRHSTYHSHAIHETINRQLISRPHPPSLRALAQTATHDIPFTTSHPTHFNMSGTKQIINHYTRILSLWPKDPLRPAQPFTNAIEHRAVPLGVTPLPKPSPSSKDAPSSSSTQTPPAAAPSTLNADAELANINALYSLLGNRYSNLNKLSPGVLKPTSNPEYYDRLMREIERAPTKSWFQAKVDEWKMKIRWQ